MASSTDSSLFIMLSDYQFKKIQKYISNRSKIFLLYFYDVSDVNLREKKLGRSTSYSCRTNVFIEFHHLMKNE